MTSPLPNTLLTTTQMASFVARGFLRLDGVVPHDINQQAMEELPRLFRSWLNELRPDATNTSNDELPLPRSGTVLTDAYHADSAFGRLVRVPAVAGAIASLVGRSPVIDHHFVHLKQAGDLTAQGLHADAIIDPTTAFDIQLFWFPHAVAPGAGGTRFVPGSHLRNVNTDEISRYQHLTGEEYFTGEAGTVVIFHHGLWHAGAPNRSDALRVMGKLRLNPTVPQVRLWDTSDLAGRTDATDHIFARVGHGTTTEMLRASEPWYEPGSHRLELVKRAKLWRYLTDDPTFDIDWYLTRTERRNTIEQAAVQ
jgi:hypothetical protein